MATAKQKATKVLYHDFFCGDRIGEADGFFEIIDGKVKLVDCWSCNDAHWRGEYMTGILSWAGVEVKRLPEKYQAEAENLLAVNWGLDYDDGSEDEDSDESAEVCTMYFQEGSSDKIYVASLYHTEDGWGCVGEYGRRGGKLKKDEKCSGVSYATAKEAYDIVIAAKLKKGYEVK